MALKVIQQRMNDSVYKNWLESVYALDCVLQSVHPISDYKMKEFHESLRTETTTVVECLKCKKGVEPDNKCDTCNIWINLIKEQHRNPTTIHWSNVDRKLWPRCHWEVAKTYMPRGQKPGMIYKPDITSVLNLMSACRIFNIEVERIKQVINTRNKVMHSMEVSDDELKEHLDKILKMLKELKTLPPEYGGDVETNMEMVVQLKDIDFTVRVDQPQSDGSGTSNLINRLQDTDTNVQNMEKRLITIVLNNLAQTLDELDDQLIQVLRKHGLVEDWNILSNQEKQDLQEKYQEFLNNNPDMKTTFNDKVTNMFGERLSIVEDKISKIESRLLTLEKQDKMQIITEFHFGVSCTRLASNGESEDLLYSATRETCFGQMHTYFKDIYGMILRCIKCGSVVFHLSVNDPNSLKKLWGRHVSKELINDLAKILVPEKSQETFVNEWKTDVDEDQYQTTLTKLNEKVQCDSYALCIVSDDTEWENQLMEYLKQRRPDINCTSMEKWKPETNFDLIGHRQSSKEGLIIAFLAKPLTDYSRYAAHSIAVVPPEFKSVTVANAWEGDLFGKVLQGLDECEELKSDSPEVTSPKTFEGTSDELTSDEEHKTHLVGQILMDRYKMDSKSRGLCIIINNIINFSTLEQRKASEKDQEKLKQIFGTKLGFTVREETNITAEKMSNVIQEASKEDHSDYDCFVCCVLSHDGNLGVVTGVDGKTCKIMDIARHLSPSNCPSLAYKPKSFFIEARQDTIKDDPTNYLSILDDADYLMIPDDRDLLFVYLTPERKAQFPYINTLAEVLDKHHKDLDVLSMLTLVTEVVCAQSTLTKKLYFT